MFAVIERGYLEVTLKMAVDRSNRKWHHCFDLTKCKIIADVCSELEKSNAVRF